MKLKEMLLDALMEECAEVIVRASKALRFGLDEIQPGQALTNRERLEAELNDLAGVLAMLPGTGVLSREWKNEAAALEKTDKVMEYLRYSRQCGTLELDEP